jgi:hypothetical protein
MRDAGIVKITEVFTKKRPPATGVLSPRDQFVEGVCYSLSHIKFVQKMLECIGCRKHERKNRTNKISGNTATC